MISTNSLPTDEALRQRPARTPAFGRLYIRNLIAVQLMFFTGILLCLLMPNPASANIDDDKTLLLALKGLTIERGTNINRKQERPLSVSIVTSGPYLDVIPIVTMIREINNIAGKEIFVINEVMTAPTRNPSTRVNPASDMVIIKGTRIMNEMFTYFMFSIIDFVNKHGSINTQQVYDDVSSKRDICRQFEWHNDETGDKILTVLDDWFGYRYFVRCSATRLLRAAGIFVDQTELPLLDDGTEGNFRLSEIVDGTVQRALGTLYRNDVRRGMGYDEIARAAGLGG